MLYKGGVSHAYRSDGTGPHRRRGGVGAGLLLRPLATDALREELDNPHAVFTVAVGEDGTVLGYVGMHHLVDEGFITNVAVSPAARRQGVARALLRHLTEYGTAHSLYHITLEVRAGNTPAIALYEGLGYVRDGVRPGFYSHPTEDAAIYSLYF